MNWEAVNTAAPLRPAGKSASYQFNVSTVSTVSMARRRSCAWQLGDFRLNMSNDHHDHPDNRFELDADGVRDNASPNTSSRPALNIDAVAWARTEDSRAWSLVVQFANRDGCQRELHIPESIRLKKAALLSYLDGEGFPVPLWIPAKIT
jgi:hypothetical protein